jgi:hypothetical protein
MSTAIEKYKAMTLAALGGDFAAVKEAMTENIGSGGITEFDLPKITIPTGGGLAFTVPTLEGETTVPELVGVIVFTRDTRTYYKTGIEEGGGGNPPDCSSTNGLIGIGKPGGNCSTCPLSKFGDDDEKPACKRGKQLFMLRGDEMLPSVFQIPTTSAKEVQKYLVKLTASGIPYQQALTAVSLERAKSASGIAYAVAKLAFVRRLTAEETAAAKAYTEMMKRLCERVAPPAAAAKASE